MTLVARCRPLLTGLAGALLAYGLARPCSALDLIEDVSKDRAKELGITVQTRTRPEDVWVQVEFTTTGPKKEFKYTYLDITLDGRRMVSANLMPIKLSPDSMRFEFYIFSAALPDATVTITIWEVPFTVNVYRIRIKSFLPHSSSSVRPAKSAGP